MAATKRLQAVDIFGRRIVTTVTNHPNAVTEWINAVNAEINAVNAEINAVNVQRYVGIELEVDYGASRVGTMQLCTRNCCLVFRLPVDKPCPPALEQFLNESHFVGTRDLPFKMSLLVRQYPIRLPTMSFLDFGENAWVLTDEKRKVMARIPMHGVVETDWARLSSLSLSQVKYAILDCFLNLHIATYLWSLEQQ